MTGIPKIIRTAAGVQFETDVLFYIAQLTEEQGRSRSFIINQIIRIYSRMAGIEPSEKAAVEQPPRGISPEAKINF